MMLEVNGEKFSKLTFAIQMNTNRPMRGFGFSSVIFSKCETNSHKLFDTYQFLISSWKQPIN